MIKTALFLILILIGLISCNYSTIKKINGTPYCYIFFDFIEDYQSLNKKEFKKKSNILKEKYGANKVNLIISVKADSIFYAEFETYRGFFKCVILDKKMKLLRIHEFNLDY